MSRDVVDAVSGEAPPKVKKSKSSKNKDKGKTVEVEQVKEKEDSEVVVDDVEEKKKKKKEKKEKKRKAEEEESESSEKKQKKQKADDDSPSDAMVVDSPEPSSDSKDASKKEKRKKRKREAQEDGDDNAETPEDKSSKKDKKKRRKDKEDKDKQDDSQTPSSSSTPTDSSSKTSTLIDPSKVAATSASDAAAFLTKHSVTINMPRPDAPAPSPIVSFSQLSSLPEKLRDAFKTFKEPSPIQACTWPPAFEGKDVVGIAETGSGKTLAFGIPAMLKLINAGPADGISTLVVAPTRELAIQTHDTLSALSQSFGIASVSVFGGVPKEGQIKMLKASMRKKGQSGGLTTRIVVGTPGRILDLMQEGHLDLSGVNYLVLDEADRMLDKGFENDIRRIIEATKPMEQRQTMMFSATWPEAVRRLASTFQRNPVRVTVGSDDLTANTRVEQSVEVFDDSRSKDQRLLNHLKKLLSHKRNVDPATGSRVLVFALYKKEASRVEQMLSRQGYGVGALHGDMSQNARMEALDRFKTGATPLLVATDVAARGLDIPNVSAVINYTFPLTIEDYIHRIGRTGRGGKSGKSITFFTGDNHERSLAGEFARVLREGGFDYEALKKFPMTIKKKEHGAYGAFYRDDIPVPKGPTKIVF